MSRILAFITTLFLASNLAAQIDFNNFQSLLAKGKIHNDFSSTVDEKYQEVLTRLGHLYKTADQRQYLMSSTEAIDEILHSGLVVYGDDISTYINELADKLLKDEPRLRSELRFYTLKSNVPNALSTNQGIIFFTTGLVAEVMNEAQLAYILAHEISHYKKHHGLESYNWRRQNHDESIVNLSSFSKENELEADKMAVEMYRNAGYEPNEIVGVFDVLMYAYLPFDEVMMPKEYMSNGQMYIPDGIWAKKTYPITAEENYDDSRSTHPNIKTRKKVAIEEIEKLNEWKETIFHLGEERFEYIRNVARFESVRIDVSEANFTNSIYSIFLLEKEFPTSTFLAEMKALSWLGILQYYHRGKKSSFIPKTKFMEGEIALFQDYIKNANKDIINTLAIRNIYDAHKAFPGNELIGKCAEHLLLELEQLESFDWSKYSKKNFDESAQLAIALAKTVDTVQQNIQTQSVKTSKYDRIKVKRSANAPESFDSTNYCMYAIPDIILDSTFYMRKLVKKTISDSTILSSELCASQVFCEKHVSDKRREYYSNQLEQALCLLKDVPYVPESENEILVSSEQFNRNVLNSWLQHEIEQAENQSFIATDYYLLRMTHQGENKPLSYVNMQYVFDPNLTPVWWTASTIFALPVAAFAVLPVQLMHGSYTTVQIASYDLESCSTHVFTTSFEGKPRKYLIASAISKALQR